MDRPGFPQWTILNFVEQLAEGTPMPGGGCAVSVAGALAAALGSLSGQISLKKRLTRLKKNSCVTSSRRWTGPGNSSWI